MIFSEYIRRFDESRRQFRTYFKIANKLGAKIISLHGDRPMGKLSVEDYCKRFEILSNDALEFGVTLCQENVNGYRSADPEFLSDMVSILGDKTNFTLDIKQSIRAGYRVEQIIKAMDNRIRHIHISDHSVAGDCLLPLNGGYDFKNLFKFFDNIGYKGDYIIEVYQNAYKKYSEIFESYKKIISL